MNLEPKALTLSASVLFMALRETEAGKELIENGYIDVKREDFKMVQGMANGQPIVPAPTLEDVIKYTEHMGYAMNAQRFFTYQQQRGWKLSSGQAIQDWRAAVDSWMTWERLPDNTIKKLEGEWETA